MNDDMMEILFMYKIFTKKFFNKYVVNSYLRVIKTILQGTLSHMISSGVYVV